MADDTKNAGEKMLRVYSIVDKGRRETFWLNLGQAWMHKKSDKLGFNIILQALPIPDRDGQVKLVVREYDPKDPKPDDDAS